MQRTAQGWEHGCKPSEAGGREGRDIPLPDTWPACDSGHCRLLSRSSARNYMAQTPPTTPGSLGPLTAQPRRHARPLRWGHAAWHHTARPCEGFLNLSKPTGRRNMAAKEASSRPMASPASSCRPGPACEEKSQVRRQRAEGKGLGSAAASRPWLRRTAPPQPADVHIYD